MRKIVFGGANSLDNFIARLNHSVDWLKWGPEAAEATKEFWRTIDTVLMGRKTFEMATKSGQRSGYPGVKNYVFSKTLDSKTSSEVTIVRSDAVNFIRKLKAGAGKDICLMGGGELARSLFEADLIDEIGLNIHPVLLGNGIPLFHPISRQIDLELIECRQFKNGCVFATWRVNHTSKNKDERKTNAP